MNPRSRLGKILVEDGRVSAEQLDKALATQKATRVRKPVGQVLLDSGAIDQKTLARALALQNDVEMVDPSTLPVDASVLWKIPRKLAEQYRAFAYRKEGRVTFVAVADPGNPNLKRDLEYLLGGPVQLEAAPESLILSAVHRHYDLEPVAQRMLDGVPKELRAAITSPTALELDAAAIEQRLGKGGSAYVDLVNLLLVNAIERGASDIHMAPQQNGTRVRFRIDGLLREVLTLPPWATAPLTSRMKVIGEMDIADKRRPQDGRARAELGSRRVDLRISTVPNQFGETVVIRILDSRTVKTELGALGWAPRQLATYFGLISQPQGLVVVVGPTGSGKSTTLYASINRLAQETNSIVTVEDPIEHTIHGVNQVQVDEGAGLTFANITRSLLRQDPNVLVIGEVRDAESAAAAVDAATTGHLVLTTVHAGNCVSAITRLRDLGVPDSLLGSAVIGVVAQRLVRRVCPVCSTLVEPGPEDWERLGLEPEPLGMLARRVGAGCPNCQYTGFRGRIGVFELLRLDDEVRMAILRGQPEQQIWAAAEHSGVTMLIEDALEKCRQGVTTLEEIARNVPLEAYHSRRRQRHAASQTVAPPPPLAPRPPAVDPLADLSAPEDGIDLLREETTDRGQKPPEVAPPRPEPKLRPKVLVVDDAEEIIQLVGATLEDDYVVIYARDGQAALDLVASEHPDALVLDVMMPKLSGYEVCRRLKEDPATADIPVLILSARGDTGHVKEGFYSGADDYLPKPFDPEELELRMRALLRRSGRLAR